MKTRHMNLSLCAATLLFGAATVVAYSSGPIPGSQQSPQQDQQDTLSNLRGMAQDAGFDPNDRFDAILITGKVNFDDTVITSKVKAAFNADPLVSSLGIEVDTKDGIVVVTGSVPSLTVRDHVIQLVATVDGVRSVKANLRVTTTT
ncbi:MAG: BON domain-containing protein [Burkholderiaceae bacterium]|nr:BON domain-containing protein [Burkholderiaceae bacterium]